MLMFLFYVPSSIAWLFSSFFFNDTATTEIYTLSLHDALPISFPHLAMSTMSCTSASLPIATVEMVILSFAIRRSRDRKSTRLNSSHQIISYAVFCLKKKNIVLGAGHLP